MMQFVDVLNRLHISNDVFRMHKLSKRVYYISHSLSDPSSDVLTLCCGLKPLSSDRLLDVKVKRVKRKEPGAVRFSELQKGAHNRSLLLLTNKWLWRAKEIRHTCQGNVSYWLVAKAARGDMTASAPPQQALIHKWVIFSSSHLIFHCYFFSFLILLFFYIDFRVLGTNLFCW